MNFASYEQQETYDTPDYYWFEPSSARIDLPVKSDSLKLLNDKFLVPSLSDETERPRLIEQVKKSLAQFSATMIAGRAGTGKSILAAQYAAQSGANVAWYKVETTDGDWKIFASYLLGTLNRHHAVEAIKFDETEVAAQSEWLAAQFSEAAENGSLLVVLDDWHSIFDVEWFADFFHSFVPSLAPSVQILFVARALPPLAVWRLRSKQVLGVVEEKTLAMTAEETVELFRDYKLAPKIARLAFQTAYGKISKLKEIAEKKISVRPASVSEPLFARRTEAVR